MGVFFRLKFTGIISRRAKTIFLPQFALMFASPKVAKNGGLGVAFSQKKILLRGTHHFF
jgi:hypothetical protein